MKEFTVHLSFQSFFKTSVLIGFCFGIGAIPVVAVFNYAHMGPSLVPMSILGGPVIGISYGVVAGLLGYPLYYWLSKNVGFKMTGNLYAGDGD